MTNETKDFSIMMGLAIFILIVLACKNCHAQVGTPYYVTKDKGEWKVDGPDVQNISVEEDGLQVTLGGLPKVITGQCDGSFSDDKFINMGLGSKLTCEDHTFTIAFNKLNLDDSFERHPIDAGKVPDGVRLEVTMWQSTEPFKNVPLPEPEPKAKPSGCASNGADLGLMIGTLIWLRRKYEEI